MILIASILWILAESVNRTKDSLQSGSQIIQGTGLSATFGEEEAQKIHQENLGKISSMTPEEILEERHKLLQTIGMINVSCNLF